MKISDFRSDTVTRPSPRMRRAMAEAEVGDDVYGEDPTVLRLERRVATLLGKEAGLFVPSGTMANQIALRVLAAAGDEVLAEERSHVVNYEGGGAAWISGLSVRPVRGERGLLDPETLRGAIRPDDVHCPRTRLVCVENTHNLAGGVPWPLERLDAVAALCRERGLALFMDGARLLNASVATGTPPADYAARADLTWIALSKGLSAPVGSVLAGDAGRIEECRRVRKALGGGMRQVGVLAAAGLVALEDYEQRLARDHDLARRLAAGAAEIEGVDVDLEAVETNIVFLDVGRGRAAPVERDLAARGVLALALDEDRVRFVTHGDIGEEDVERALVELRAVTKPR